MNKMERFRAKLREQLGFIQSSCQSFDIGVETEAIRIAASLRILFHDKGRSVSVLQYLKLKSGNMLSSPHSHNDWRDFLGHKLDLSSPNPIQMYALRHNQLSETPVLQWWEGDAIFSDSGIDYTRKCIVLSMADKDGGAHVDETLERYYEVLCSGRFALGVTGNLQYAGEAPFEQGVTQYSKNAHFALMRQFAHEVLASAGHFKWIE